MRVKTPQWRYKIINACQVVAKAVSQTDSGTAHLVQRMMQSPKLRDETMATALTWAGPGGSHYEGTEQYQAVQAAVDLLRGYAGTVL